MKKLNEKPEKIIEAVARDYPEIWDVLNRVRNRVTPNKRAIAEYQAAVLYWLVSEHMPKRILEIGTALGYSAAIMAEAFPHAEIITLNPQHHEVVQAKQNLRPYPNVHVLEQRSWDYLRGYDGEDFDFIFIDGDHARVRLDIPWWDKLHDGGIIFFHDYSPAGSYRECPPVYECVNEFADLLGRQPDILVTDEGGVGVAGFVKDGTPLADEDQMALIQAHVHSSCTLEYLRAIYRLAETVKRRMGAIVEAGVQNGGSAAALALGTRRKNRSVYLYDTFDGIPEPDPQVDGGKAYAKWQAGGWCAADSPERCREIIEELVDDARVVVYQGLFAETMKKVPPRILILHVDATLYQSTKETLETMYRFVVEGGIVIVGAYGHWPGVRRAVDEFVASLDETPLMVPVDGKGVTWRKA